MVCREPAGFGRRNLPTTADEPPCAPIACSGSRHRVFAIETTCLSRQPALPIAENDAVFRICERPARQNLPVYAGDFGRQFGERYRIERGGAIPRLNGSNAHQRCDAQTCPPSEQSPPRLQPTQQNHGESLNNDAVDVTESGHKAQDAATYLGIKNGIK